VSICKEMDSTGEAYSFDGHGSGVWWDVRAHSGESRESGRGGEEKGGGLEEHIASGDLGGWLENEGSLFSEKDCNKGESWFELVRNKRRGSASFYTVLRPATPVGLA
jgi:hypothetical protein